MSFIGRPYRAPGTRRGAVAEVRRRTSARERPPVREMVLAAATALLVALVLVWVRLQVVHVGYDLSAARQVAGKLEQEQRELALEISTLTSPRRLEQMARVRLGMRPPEAEHVITSPATLVAAQPKDRRAKRPVMRRNPP